MRALPATVVVLAVTYVGVALAQAAPAAGSEPREYLPWVLATMAVGGFLLNVIVQIRGGAWNQAARENKMKEDLSNEIKASAKVAGDSIDKLRSETTQNLAELNMDVEKARKEAVDQHNDTFEKFGETIAAIKQKVNDEALYSERHYLQKKDHQVQVESHQKSFDTLDRKIDDRFNRIERLIFEGPASTTRRGGGGSGPV